MREVSDTCYPQLKKLARTREKQYLFQYASVYYIQSWSVSFHSGKHLPPPGLVRSPLYKLYRYVRRQSVQVLNHFGQEMCMDFHNSGL